MGTLQEQLKKARLLNPQRINKAVFDYIRTLEPILARLNRDQIEKNSSDIFGNPLGFYSNGSELITTQKSLLGGGKIKYEGDPFNLLDSGDFLKGLFAKVGNGFVLFDTTDPKKEEIFSNPNLLSTDIFGLTDDNLKVFIEVQVAPFLLRHIRKTIGI